MKKLIEKVKREDAVLIGAGLIILAALFIRWLGTDGDKTAAGIAAAVLSAVLFAAFGVRFVGAWMDQWRSMRENGRVRMIREPVRPAVLIRIAVVCLAACAAALLLVYIFQLAGGSRQRFSDAVRIWERLDSQQYLGIARDWYLSDAELDRRVQLVFLPGYPMAIRLVHLVIRDWLAAGFAVSSLSFAGAGVMLYRLARLDTDHAGALRALKYTLILPGAFFFAAPMSESLFFLLSVSCLYCLRRGGWLAAGVLGGLAAFTRSLGITLLVPAGYIWLTELIASVPEGEKRTPVSRRAAQLAALLLIPAGFGAYCLVCRSVSGDAFKFLEYQREHWNQSAGLFFSTAAYQTEYALGKYASGELDILMGLWVPNLLCSFGALAVMMFAARRIKPAYSAYFLAYYVIAVGTTWLLSAPRYLTACAPLPLALSGLTEDRRTDDVLTVVLTVLYALYAMCMANRWQVW